MDYGIDVALLVLGFIAMPWNGELLVRQKTRVSMDTRAPKGALRKGTAANKKEAKAWDRGVFPRDEAQPPRPAEIGNRFE
ncbi:MAG: hypothetical protein AB1898_22290 [Acidobacteriota bacterium]